jgi:hypothetical protein
MLEYRSTYPAASATVLYTGSRETALARKLKLLLFAHLQADAGCGFSLERSILVTEPIKLGPQIFIGHDFSPPL